MKRNLIIILTIVSLIWLLPAAARTYRWVDENGNTVYSQSRPPAGDVTVIKPPPPPATSPDEAMKKLKNLQDALDNSRKTKGTAQQKEADEAKKAEIRKQNCATSRQALADIEPHARIRMKMDDGSYKQLTDEERQEQVDKAKKNIETYCD